MSRVNAPGSSQTYKSKVLRVGVAVVVQGLCPLRFGPGSLYCASLCRRRTLQHTLYSAFTTCTLQWSYCHSLLFPLCLSVGPSKTCPPSSSAGSVSPVPPVSVPILSRVRIRRIRRIRCPATSGILYTHPFTASKFPPTFSQCLRNSWWDF